ncbi:MAG TPA: DinB family protein [Thermoanaerobaculia bacterium]|nr:DinB family protein [Thermoanaerobaculia bacterium]
MSIAQTLLPEFDHEMAITRKLLERIQDDQLDWRPHEKSMALGYLSSHLAELAGWGAVTLAQDTLDIAPPGGEPYRPSTLSSRQEILERFDQNAKETRGLLEQAEDAKFFETWTFLIGGQVIFQLPRAAVLRTWLMNHIIHHRGQLSVYLRLTGQPVPSIYGPSADEQS